MAADPNARANEFFEAFHPLAIAYPGAMLVVVADENGWHASGTVPHEKQEKFLRDYLATPTCPSRKRKPTIPPGCIAPTIGEFDCALLETIIPDGHKFLLVSVDPTVEKQDIAWNTNIPPNLLLRMLEKAVEQVRATFPESSG